MPMMRIIPIFIVFKDVQPSVLVSKETTTIRAHQCLSVFAFNDRRDILRRVIRSIFVLFSLGLFTVVSAQLPPEINTEETCAGKPVGSSCWMALANHPEYYVWNSGLAKDATVT